MASTDDVRLLSLIESSHAGGVFASVSDYLRPYTATSSTSRKQDPTLIVRSLGKQFLPFLNKSIARLSKRLFVVANSDKEARDSAEDLFRAYELCVGCLESVSAQCQSTCKPHTVHLYRLRMIECLDAWGFYENVNTQAFKLLEKLRRSDISSRKCRLLPEVQDGEADLAEVIVGTVAYIFKAVKTGQQTDDEPYRRALLLLEEVRAWFRVLDAKVYKTLHGLLVTSLGECALSLVREAERFDGEFVRSFCDSTVKEHFKFALSKYRIYKFAREVLSVLFTSKDRRMSVTIDISMSLLRSLTCHFVVETDEDLVDFVALVSFCAHEFRAAGGMYCAQVSKKFSEMAAIFSEAIPQLNLILRLYSSGLSITVYDSKSGESKLKGATDDWKFQALLDDEVRWQSLVSLLGMVGGHNNCNNKTNDSCTNRSNKTCWPQYVDALKFLCQPLAVLIRSVKRKILLKTEIPCVSAHLSTIHDAFLQFCDDCLLLRRCTSDKGGRETDNDKALFNVALAAFIVSLRTQLKLEISAHLVEDVIASPWIRSLELKYLSAQLYQIGFVLNNNKELTKACEALKLCLKASWRCVEQHCSPSDNGLSEDDIMDFVGETCDRCAFYLDIVNQCSSCEIKQTIVPILEIWLSAEHQIRRLPGPAAIVKQWVQIERGCHTNVDADDSCTTLYSLLSSSQKKSKRGIGKILHQELLAYDEIADILQQTPVKIPDILQQTRIKIADILLKDVYVTKDMHIDRARILIWKARMTRESGTEHLTDCIDFLSEAISILGEVHHRPNKEGASSSHQLPIAYSLRAFCKQEAEPNSKEVIQDISTSLNLWLRIPSLDDSGDSLPAENIIPLLYNMIDLMSVKGCTELHHHIYQLVFRLFKWKNVKLEVCLAMLWECRRLSHALCPSPISDAFIRSLSENCGDKSTCIDFWIDCLKDSKANLIGFQQNFHDLHNDFIRTSNKDKGPFQSDITTDDITDAASELISSASLSGHSSFVAAYLYYDLCERLISFGKISEALSYAKESYRIRTLIFHKKFKYRAKQLEKHNDAGEISEIQTYSITNFQVLESEATDFWPCGNFLWDIKRSYLSPWNVLQCYLEINVYNLEASCLGPWRCLLLGDLPNYKLSDSVQKKLVKDLKSKCKMKVNEMLLKVILGGGVENFKGEACIAQLSLRNGCYIGRGGYLYDEDSCKTPTASSNISESRHGLALQLIHEAAAKLEEQHDGHENREAIILVLDPEVQMLPWENIPILRNQEVYRMPCVGSISAVLKKRCLQGEPARSDVASFPLIDPQDSFYLLNPSGDFRGTQVEFESWFRDQNFEGKAGLVPSSKALTEALKNALKSHDLFLYLGHGSGAQYLPSREIEELDNCCAAFLMGCSSGSPWVQGFPQGVPLSYLLAGSPAIVANLWDVTDKDIDRFGKALLIDWLRERSDSEGGCSQCESLSNELAAMNLKGNTKRSRRKKPAQSNGDGSGKIECNHKHRRKIGSFIPAAREACELKYLNGAAPVCYGVPTGITKKIRN